MKSNNMKWVEDATKDFNELAEELKIKVIALNQKHFQKDTGMRLISGTDSNDVKFIIDFPDIYNDNYFMKRLVRDIQIYFDGKNATEILDFADKIREVLMQGFILKSDNK